MRIGGLQKSSLLDYPGKISAVIFTIGCNFCCGFCHNQELIIDCSETFYITEEAFFSFLDRRKKLLDAVVITGGEPTLQKDLIDFIRRIKEKGFLVKLDTNGTNPRVMERLIGKGMIDFYAMDIKHRVEKEAYECVTARPIDITAINESISLIQNSGADYEFRTTLIEGLHTFEDVISIAQTLKGSRRYVLQKFVSREVLNDSTYKSKKAFSHKQLTELARLCSDLVKECTIR
ncbi:MAG: anaerobic ribonucleoside-triphosphate reductase activating protein [bacterium]